MEEVIVVIMIVLIVVAVGLAFRSKPDRKHATTNEYRISRRLWRQLVLLTKDEQVAHRLVRSLLLKYPDRDADWCCEKAIYDIERDRHRH